MNCFYCEHFLAKNEQMIEGKMFSLCDTCNSAFQGGWLEGRKEITIDLS